MGFLHMLVTMLLIGVLLRMTRAALPGFGRRVAFVALAGLTAAVWANLGQPIWFFHPWAYHLGTTLYDVIARLAAGFILARFAVPRSKAVSRARAVAVA